MARTISERDQKNVETITNMVNNFSFSEKNVCELLQSSHKTLQQTFTRLCVEWLIACGQDDYRFDDRNEASHKVGKMILEKIPEEELRALPFI